MQPTCFLGSTSCAPILLVALHTKTFRQYTADTQALEAAPVCNAHTVLLRSGSHVTLRPAELACNACRLRTVALLHGRQHRVNTLPPSQAVLIDLASARDVVLSDYVSLITDALFTVRSLAKAAGQRKRLRTSATIVLFELNEDR